MNADLHVPAGTILHLMPGEWQQTPTEPAGQATTIRAVAVYTAQVGGLVWVRAHDCAGTEPDCGTAACWERQVSVAAIRRNLAGQR